MTTQTDFRKILAGIAHSRTRLQVFETFTRLAACALACRTREAEYLEAVRGWDRPELETLGAALGALVLEMNDQPFTDVLGPHYMELLGANAAGWRGEFHTPQPVCELMARMLAGPVPPEGPIELAEPCCGSGAMILAYAAALPQDAVRRLRVVAADLNPVACDMTFINTTLWGIPCTIMHQNTLSLQLWAQWRNVHALCPFLHLLAQVRGDAQATPGAPDEPVPDAADRIQIAPAPALTPADQAAAAALQGTPPTAEQLEPLRATLRNQLDFGFLLEERAAV